MSPEWLSAIAACIGAVGVIFIALQVKIANRQLHVASQQLAFSAEQQRIAAGQLSISAEQHKKKGASLPLAFVASV